MSSNSPLLHVKIILFVICSFGSAKAQQQYSSDWSSLNQRKIPAWFQDARFGIFIHWGVYAVPSYAPVRPDGYSEWYWYTLKNKNRHSHDETEAFHNKVYGKDFDYKDFEKQFKAELFDPAQWAKLFKRSGARYVVLTSKHHEGYCLWNNEAASKAYQRPWNAVQGTPKRDLLGDLTTAVRKEGIRMGYYYSLYEWFNPLWQTDQRRYIDSFMIPQFKDLVTKYQPSIIFSDGEWSLSDSAWRSPETLAWLFNESPVKDEVVVNDRWGSKTRSKNPSTYYTSEYGTGLGPDVIWEESKGMGQSYGYNRAERLEDYKSANNLILDLVDIVSRGGNLLLDIGPAADGTIPVVMQERLTSIGDWLQLNGEAIYESRPWKNTRSWSKGIKPVISTKSYQAHYDIAGMIVPKKDTAHIEAFYTTRGGNLYVIVPGKPAPFVIPGFKLPPGAAVEWLGSKTTVPFIQQKEGLLLQIKSRPAEVPPGGIYVIKIRNALK